MHAGIWNSNKLVTQKEQMNSSLQFFSSVFTAKSFISWRLKLRNVSPRRHSGWFVSPKCSVEVDLDLLLDGAVWEDSRICRSEPCVLSGIGWTSPSSASLPSSWQLQESGSYCKQQQSVGSGSSSGSGSGSDPPVFAAGHENISISLCPLLVLLFQRLSMRSVEP